MPRINWNDIAIGTERKSIQQWCDQVGKVDVDTAKRRIYYGNWPAAQAVGLEPRRKYTWSDRKRARDRTLVFEGKEHTLKEWSEIKKIAYRTLIDRYERYGADRPEDILDQRRQTRTLVLQKRTERALSEMDPGPEWKPEDVFVPRKKRPLKPRPKKVT